MHVAIIGNGIAGITAARTLRKRDASCRISVISSETEHFFSRTALMYIYMGHMSYEDTKPYEDHFWKKNDIELHFDRVERVDFKSSVLYLSNSGEMNYDKLILATGSRSRLFDWPGMELNGVQGLYSFQDLELLEKNTHGPKTKASAQRVKKAVIVGGGLIGVELAEMLCTRNIEVCFLVRDDRFWGSVLPKEEAELIQRHLKDHGVDIVFKDELEKIEDDGKGNVGAVLTKKGQRIECQFVGLTTGVTPNVEFLRNTDLEVDRGILVDSKLQTNIHGVFAAGDCAQFRKAPDGRKEIEQVWYTARTMGEIAGMNCLGDEAEYRPGPWFNSAKFFDIEYQTYGRVGNELSQDEQCFIWTNEAHNLLLKIVHHKESKQIHGVNVLGIRLRHELLDHYLKTGADISELLQNWRKLCFDPEFYKDHSKSIIEHYNKTYQQNLIPQKKTWKDYVFG